MPKVKDPSSYVNFKSPRKKKRGIREGRLFNGV